MDAEDAIAANRADGNGAALGPDEIRVRGNIVARLDRLPLNPQLWTYALIAQLFWGAVLAIDPVALRLYPVIWLPAHAFSHLQYDILVGFENGAGVLVGQVIFTYLADRYGRKPLMIASCIVAFLFVWPVAYTSNWPLLMVFVSLAAIGVGGCLGLSNVYTVEIAPPTKRARLSLGSQILAAVVINLISGLLPYYMLPTHYKAWVWVTALIPVVIVMPLIAFVLPESPRWLESRERTDKAETIMAGMERRAEKWTHQPLPEPQYDQYTVVVEEGSRVPVGELFRGVYAQRTMVILTVWILGYAGLDYGMGSQQGVFLIGYYSVSDLFLITFLGGLSGTLLMTVIGAFLNERVERRTWIFIAGLMSFAGGVIYYYWAKDLWLAVLATLLASGAVLTWAFNGYTMIATAYPTRLRATASGFTDGLGHVGAVFGPIFAGWLFTATASHNHIGWFLEFGVLGGLVPGIVSLVWGMRQKEAILEVISQ
jgi:MFS family permease